MIAATNRGGRAGGRFAWTLAVLLTAACAAPPKESLSENRVVPMAPLEPSRVETREPAAATKRAPTEVARAAPAPPPLILPALKDLIGKSQDQVAALFGKPTLVRHDEPARLVQYRAKECALDIFLYREGAAYAVSYTEVRGANSAVIKEADCVRAVLKAKIGAGTVR